MLGLEGIVPSFRKDGSMVMTEAKLCARHFYRRSQINEFHHLHTLQFYPFKAKNYNKFVKIIEIIRKRVYIGKKIFGGRRLIILFP